MTKVFLSVAGRFKLTLSGGFVARAYVIRVASRSSNLASRDRESQGEGDRKG